MTVAGPTLEDNFGQFFGSVPNPPSAICATFFFSGIGQATVQSVSVGAPFTATQECQLPTGSADPAPCAPGSVLTGFTPDGGEPTGCWLAVDLASGETGNHQASVAMTLTAECSGGTEPPCDEVSPAPTPENPVKVTWTATLPLRFCGQTAYADENGQPLVPDGEGRPVDPSVGSAADGCTQAPA